MEDKSGTNIVSTIEYYNKNAETFVNDTNKVDFRINCERFLKYVSDKGRILDFGCGSGRDTKYFLDKGYDVDAIDGSEQMCKIAGECTGIGVKQMQFADFHEQNIYDGIWACASILHLPKDELGNVLINLRDALKANGYLYTSFKLGTFEGVRDSRYFTCFTQELFVEFIKEIPGLKIIDEWISNDVRKDRENEKWINVILNKE